MSSTRPAGLHVLYVSWGFPPHRGPGTYRGLASVNALAEAGHRVTVLTADLATFDVVIGADRSLLDRIHPAVAVHRVAFPAVRADPVVSRWPVQRARARKAWAQDVDAHEGSLFPERVYASWRPRVEAAAYRLHRKDPVDLVIATGNPYVDFVPAFHLGVEFGVPYVLDDRDTWLLDVYTGEEREPGGLAEQYWTDMLERSAQAWFVNPPIADWYRTRFPDQAQKIRVVENGWDAEYLPTSREPKKAAPGGSVFGYVGTISRGLPLELLLEAWTLARPELGRGAELRFFGQLGHGGAGDANRTELFADHARLGVRHLGRWPKVRIDEAYRGLDALLFAKEGGGLVTSGKVYEYAATGRPIVCAVEPEHDARRVLADYPRRHDPASLTAEGIAAALVSAARDAEAGEQTRVASALAAGAQYERSQLLAPVLEDLLAQVSS